MRFSEVQKEEDEKLLKQGTVSMSQDYEVGSRIKQFTGNISSMEKEKKILKR